MIPLVAVPKSIAKYLKQLISLNYYLLGIMLALSPATAQVTPDGTTNTTVDAQGNNITINDGDRAGNNLFHSFQDFSVPDGGSASFNNEQAIENIFSRVTGGNISNINGVIDANGSANLFLVNPAGIIFGENASLSVGGSFYGTSANSILFENGEFSATDLNNPPVLTINAPIGLGFRDNPGDIVNRSVPFNDLSLTVNEGESISLIGGNVSFENGGQILAPGAGVNLGGLTEAGRINFAEDGSLNFPDNLARDNVSITDSSRIIVSSDGGGFVKIDAKNFELISGSRIDAGIIPDSGFQEAQAGNIAINTTEDVLVDGGGESLTAISNSAFSIGNAGNIDIKGRNISLVNGSNISSFIDGSGNAGNITLNATEDIRIDGIFANQLGGVFNSQPSASLVDDTAIIEETGIPGTTNITARNLTLTNGAQISSLNTGIGDSGDININVIDSVNIDGEGELLIDGITTQINSQINTEVVGSGSGNSGNINIFTNNLSLTNGGEIDTNSFGIGNAGDINISAKTINIDGRGEFQERVDDSGQVSRFATPSSIASEVLSTVNISDQGVVAEGNSGTIRIDTNSLSITNGGEINADVNGIGDGGNVLINAQDSVFVQGRETRIFDGETINLFSGISSNVLRSGIGNSGNVEINTAELSVEDGATISVSTFGEGNAGNLSINATDSVKLLSESSIISNVVENAIGNSGEVNIKTGDLTINDISQIEAASIGIGEAGNLSIDANSISLENMGGINASTPIGNGGNISLNVAEDITLSNGSLISSEAFNDASGGNLIIDTNFIVAFPNQDSNIIATAEQGDGGNININAQALFGIEEREAVPGNTTNDIDASSEFGLTGTVSINTPDLNPIQGATELPSDVIEPEQTVAQACATDYSTGEQKGLVVKGKGGISPEPVFPLNPEGIVLGGELFNPDLSSEADNTSKLSSESGLVLKPEDIVLGGELFNPKLPKAIKHTATSSPIKLIATAKGNIVPARGIKLTKNGDVILTAYQTQITSRIHNNSSNCVNRAN